LSIIKKTISELCQGLESRQFSSREITEAYLQRIEQINTILNAYITLTPEAALKAADEADARRANGLTLSPLDGIPVAVKDNYCTRGVLTTCASKMLNNFTPPYDASLWKKIAGAGAVLTGKTNMDEFAFGSTGETSAYGVTRNPFDIERVPGGSSSGSAAAVAADMAAFSLVTDTGGSTRIPAHFCGLVGIKPTYGRISRYGIIPCATSFDQAGILAKSVYDAATVMEIAAGHDVLDANTLPVAVGAYREACRRPIKGMKIGLPREFKECGIEQQTLAELERAATLLREHGATVEETSLPHTAYAQPAYYALSAAEASSNMARYDGVNFGLRVERDNVYDMISATRTEGFGEAAKIRILLGTYITCVGHIEAYYNRALQIRTLIKRDYDKVFADGYDCLLTPVTAGTAFQLGAKTEDPLSIYLTSICTTPANLAGLPGISVPFCQQNGLPLGLQLIGRPWGEEAMFSVAAAMEQPRLAPPDILAQAQVKGVEKHD